MLLKAKLTVLLTVFSCAYLMAQDWNDYKPVQSEGQIPKEFLSSSTEKFISKVESISSEKKRHEKVKEEQFYLQSTFNIDQLLLSGNVLFNDPVSIYVNRVADELLKDNAGLRKKLKFYVVKSPISNAFATERGAIFINIGLLARLENEAQLAFILSHEITHYTKNHVLKRYINNRDMTDRKSKNYKQYKKSSDYEVLLAKSNYSKRNEKEADRIGLDLFLKSNYSTENIEQIFDVLKASEQPYESIDFKKISYKDSDLGKLEALLTFEDEKDDEKRRKKGKNGKKFIFKIGEREYEQVEGDEDNEDNDDDRLSTHPAPEERKELVEEMLEGKNSSGSQFIISEEEFKNIQHISRFELVGMFLSKRAYLDALYHSLLLLQTNPESDYLELCVAKSLYGLSKYANESEKFNQYLGYDNIPGKLESLSRNSKMSTRAEINALALDFAYGLYHKDTTNLYLERISLDLINDGLEYNNPIFRSESEDSTMVSLFKESRFNNLYDWQVKERKRIADRESYFETKKGKKELDKWQKGIRRKGFSVGTDKVVVFSPLSVSLDFRKGKVRKNNSALDYVLAEKNQEIMKGSIDRASESVGIEVEFLDARAIDDPNDTDKLNDISIINSWYSEVLNHDDIEEDFIPSNYDAILLLSEKYNTPYFSNTGILSYKAKRTGKGWHIAAMFAYYPFSLFYAPVAIGKVATPVKEYWVIA